MASITTVQLPCLSVYQDTTATSAHRKRPRQQQIAECPADFVVEYGQGEPDDCSHYQTDHATASLRGQERPGYADDHAANHGIHGVRPKKPAQCRAVLAEGLRSVEYA
ncbi:MAG: hypothetical protein ACHQWU_15810 [Gemmatimonadales bacterium]